MFSTEEEYLTVEAILQAEKYSDLTKKQQELVEFGCFFYAPWIEAFKNDEPYYIHPASLATLLEDKPDYYERLNPRAFRTYESLAAKFSDAAFSMQN
ncbi:hypothetical protein [Enterococcus sp. LJL90]